MYEMVLVLIGLLVSADSKEVTCRSSSLKEDHYGFGFDVKLSLNISVEGFDAPCQILDEDQNTLAYFWMKLITDGQMPDQIKFFIDDELQLHNAAVTMECRYFSILWDKNPSKVRSAGDVVYSCNAHNPKIQLRFKTERPTLLGSIPQVEQMCSIDNMWSCPYPKSPKWPKNPSQADLDILGERCIMQGGMTGIAMFGDEATLDCLWCGPCQKFDNSKSVMACANCTSGGIPKPSPAMECQHDGSVKCSPSSAAEKSTIPPTSQLETQSPSPGDTVHQEVMITGVDADSVSNTSAILRWCPPMHDVLLKIKLTNNTQTGWNKWSTEPSIPKGAFYYEFSNLEPSTFYEFSIQALDQFTLAPLGPITVHFFTTLPNIPRPSEVSYSAGSDGSIEVEWNGGDRQSNLNAILIYKKKSDFSGNISLGPAYQHRKVIRLPVTGHFSLLLQFTTGKNNGPPSEPGFVEVQWQNCDTCCILLVVVVVIFVIILVVYCVCKHCCKKSSESMSDSPPENEGLSEDNKALLSSQRMSEMQDSLEATNTSN